MTHAGIQRVYAIIFSQVAAINSIVRWHLADTQPHTSAHTHIHTPTHARTHKKRSCCGTGYQLLTLTVRLSQLQLLQAASIGGTFLCRCRSPRVCPCVCVCLCADVWWGILCMLGTFHWLSTNASGHCANSCTVNMAWDCNNCVTQYV